MNKYIKSEIKYNEINKLRHLNYLFKKKKKKKC